MYAKDKNVRYRSAYLVSEMIYYLGEIECVVFGPVSVSAALTCRSDKLYQELRAQMIERLQDKEASVRSQAVQVLSKLSLTESDEDLRPEETITEHLRVSLIHDKAS